VSARAGFLCPRPLSHPLHPSGTDAADVLLNRVIPLRIGYVAVVNRGQRDIDSNLTIREALRKEAGFFKAHPVYRSMLKQCTTPTLTRMLNNILMHHIR